MSAHCPFINYEEEPFQENFHAYLKAAVAISSFPKSSHVSYYQYSPICSIIRDLSYVHAT